MCILLSLGAYLGASRRDDDIESSMVIKQTSRNRRPIIACSSKSLTKNNYTAVKE